MEEFKSLLWGTFRRFHKARLSATFWCLLAFSYLALPFISPVMDASPEEDWTLAPAVVLMFSAAFWAIFYVAWELTRSSADFENRAGSFWPWLGWGLLSYLPTIIAIMAIYYSHDQEEFGYAEALAFTLLPVLTVPLMVHASGRAIDSVGPSFADIWAYWRQNYIALVAVYLLLTGPAMFLSEAIYIWFGNEGMPVEVASSLLYLPAFLLGTVMTVEAYHRVTLKLPA